MKSTKVFASRSRSFLSLLGAALTVFGGAACGEENAIVGGVCLPGYVKCGSDCIASATGTCDQRGTGDPSPDAATGNTGPGNDSGTGTGTGTNGNDAGRGHASNLDAGTTSGDGAVSPVEDASIGTIGQDDAGGVANDGSSTTNPFGSWGAFCGGGYVNTAIDPLHCGGCNAFCPSERCSEGICKGSVAGHIVMIGHDYSTAISPPPNLSSRERLLANAVLLSHRDNARVLLLGEYANTAALQNAQVIVTRATSSPITFSVGTNEDMATLSTGKYDVVVIHDQVNANGRFRTTGTQLAPVLDRFVKNSGVVVLLGGTPETIDFTIAANLVPIRSSASAVGLHTVVPLDRVSMRVPSPYAANSLAVVFDAAPESPSFRYVVTDEQSKPVVLHATRQAAE